MDRSINDGHGDGGADDDEDDEEERRMRMRNGGADAEEADEDEDRKMTRMSLMITTTPSTLAHDFVHFSRTFQVSIEISWIVIPSRGSNSQNFPIFGCFWWFLRIGLRDKLQETTVLGDEKHDFLSQN